MSDQEKWSVASIDAAVDLFGKLGNVPHEITSAFMASDAADALELYAKRQGFALTAQHLSIAISFLYIGLEAGLNQKWLQEEVLR